MAYILTSDRRLLFERTLRYNRKIGKAGVHGDIHVVS